LEFKKDKYLALKKKFASRFYSIFLEKNEEHINASWEGMGNLAKSGVNLRTIL
jgi:hypothetical protein